MTGARAAWLWAGVAALVFAPALGGEFLNWDDGDWIVTNPLVTTPGGRAWIDTWLHPTLGAYYPVTLTASRICWAAGAVLEGWLGEGAAWAVMGGRAAPFHLLSILGFAAAVALWHEVLRRLGIGAAGRTLAVLWFGLHPLRVESVAWAAALRDVLSLDLVLLAALAHLSARPAARRFGAPAAFAAAVLAKSMVFTLAPLGLLLDVLWFRRPLVPAVRRALPMLAIALAGAVVAYLAYRPIAAANHYPTGSLWTSLPVIAAIQLRYLRLQIAPVDLAALPATPEPGAAGWLALAGGVALVAAAVALLRRGHRAPLLVVLLYLLPMAPVCGLLPLAWPVADRYTLLPSLAVAGALGWGAQRLADAPPWDRALRPAAGVVGALLAVSTVLTIPAWRDSETLWRTSLQRFPNEFAAHQNYAGAVGQRGRMGVAAYHLWVALDLVGDREPDHTRLVGLLMFAELLRAGVPMSRIDGYRAAYDAAGTDPSALASLGLDLAAAHLGPASEAVLRRAEQLGADGASLHLARGTFAAVDGRWDRALAHAVQGLADDPDQEQLLALHVTALLQLGERDAALRAAGDIVRLHPRMTPEAVIRNLERHAPKKR